MAAHAVLSPFLLSLIVFVNTAPFYWPLPPFVWLTAARLSHPQRKAQKPPSGEVRDTGISTRPTGT